LPTSGLRKKLAMPAKRAANQGAEGPGKTDQFCRDIQLRGLSYQK
jgi:hypothetical protein